MNASTSGHLDEAEAAFRKVFELNSDFPRGHQLLGRAYLARSRAEAETSQAFEWLERAYAQRDAGLVLVKGDPLLEDLEPDPRYKAFLKKMRLPL